MTKIAKTVNVNGKILEVGSPEFDSEHQKAMLAMVQPQLEPLSMAEMCQAEFWDVSLEMTDDEISKGLKAKLDHDFSDWRNIDITLNGMLDSFDKSGNSRTGFVRLIDGKIYFVDSELDLDGLKGGSFPGIVVTGFLRKS